MKRTLSALAVAPAVLLWSGFALAGGLADGDAAHGKELFKKCAQCHTLVPGEKKIGPNLHGLFGRKAGTLDGFSYSFAMKLSGVVWDEKTLNEYLKNPTMFIPGARMLTGGIAAEKDRRDLLAYLKQATAGEMAEEQAPEPAATQAAVPGATSPAPAMTPPATTQAAKPAAPMPEGEVPLITVPGLPKP